MINNTYLVINTVWRYEAEVARINKINAELELALENVQAQHSDAVSTCQDLQDKVSKHIMSY